MPVIVRYRVDIDGHLAGETFQVPNEELAALYHPNAEVIAATSDVFIPAIVEDLTVAQLAQVQTLINSTIEPITVNFVIDGGEGEIQPGVKGDFQVQFDATILEWALFADPAGSIVVDLWRSSYAAYPPLVGNSITGAAKPTLVSDVKANSSNLTGWTPGITQGDVFRVVVDSAQDAVRVTLSLRVLRA